MFSYFLLLELFFFQLNLRIDAIVDPTTKNDDKKHTIYKFINKKEKEKEIRKGQ